MTSVACMCAGPTLRTVCLCSETRAAHKLSVKLNREIIIGGTTLDTPSEFLEHLKVCVSPARVMKKLYRPAATLHPPACKASEMPLQKMDPLLSFHRSWEWDRSIQHWRLTKATGGLEGLFGPGFGVCRLPCGGMPYH